MGKWLYPQVDAPCADLLRCVARAPRWFGPNRRALVSHHYRRLWSRRRWRGRFRVAYSAWPNSAKFQSHHVRIGAIGQDRGCSLAPNLGKSGHIVQYIQGNGHV